MEEMKNGSSPQESREDILRRIQTSDSVWLPRDVFESIYLNPERKVAGDLRQKFGNPTPIGILGLVCSAFPLSACYMGWRGAGGHGGALTTVTIFFGGLLITLSALGEWILGNTFASCVLFTFGALQFADGTLFMPAFATGALYSPEGNSLEGMATPGFAASFGFFGIAMAIVCLIFAVFSLRVNLIFFILLIMLVATFGTIGGAQFKLAEGDLVTAHKLTVAGGAFMFAVAVFGFYLLIVMLADSVDFPITLPVGDLSERFPSKSNRQKIRSKNSENSV